MVTWRDSLLDPRFHLTVLAFLITSVIVMDRPKKDAESSWGIRQLALLREEPEPRPTLPVIAPGTWSEESFRMVEESAEWP